MDKKTSKMNLFGAVNSTEGFRSFFDETVASEDYDKVILIKGGSGTGKSTLMKNLQKHFDALGCFTQGILCSSDPNSYDGVLIERDGRRAALLDATAPHERGCAFPGVIDEICDLGEFWDENALKEHKEQIVTLCKKKAEDYKAAYRFLHIFGEISRTFTAESNITVDEVKMKNSFRTVLEKVKGPIKNGNVQRKIISSLSKNGLCHVEGIGEYYEDLYFLDGTEEENLCYLSHFAKHLQEQGFSYTQFIGVPDVSRIEGIAFDDAGMAVLSFPGFGRPLSPAGVTSHPRDEKTVSALSKMKEQILSLAVDRFVAASEAHFSLEAIYTPTMDFQKITEKTHILTKKLEDVLYR